MGLLLFYFIMIFNVIALVYAIFVVPENIMDEEVHPFIFLIPFPPFLVGLDFSITGLAAVTFFLLLAAAIFVSIETIIMREGRSFWSLGMRLLSENDLSKEEEITYDGNGFVLLGELFMAVLFFNVCYIVGLLLLGIETETPDFGEWSAWEQMFAFAEASVWEEVISRIMLIGVPLFMLRAYTTRDFGFESLDGGAPFRRKWHNYLLGGNFSITPLTAVLIFLSSLLFGLAHMSSWDTYKVAPTVVAGLALGYLFVKKGVHVSILLHFAIDYLTVLPSALDNEIAILLEVMIGLVVLILISLGGYMFYKYARTFMNFVGLNLLQFGAREPQLMMVAGNTGQTSGMEMIGGKVSERYDGNNGSCGVPDDGARGWGPDEESHDGGVPDDGARGRRPDEESHDGGVPDDDARGRGIG